MENNIKLRATYQESDGKWYLDIVPPLRVIGNVAVQEGAAYFKQKFDSQKEAYEFGIAYLSSIGAPKEFIDNKINYE